MATLGMSRGDALLASVGVAWIFFFLSWLFERAFFVKPVRKWLSSHTKISPTDMEEVLSGIHIRAVGSVHNTIQVVLSLYALTDPVLWNDSWYAATRLSEILAIISTGFFIWDLAVAIRRVKTDGPEFVMHGLLCGAFYLYVTISGNHHFYGCGFVLWEVSTPFVHLRWLLYKTGFKKSKIYTYNGLMMMVVFGCCRIVWGTYLSLRFVFSSFSHHEIPQRALWPLYAICILLNGLNWSWFKAMVMGAARLVMKKPLHVEDVKIKENGIKQN